MAGEDEFDIVVIGGGPGGYATALYGAAAGLSVAIIERDKVGGTCLHRGCIPAKEFLETAAVYRTIEGSKEFGIETSGVSIDFVAQPGSQERRGGQAVQGPGRTAQGPQGHHVVGHGHAQGGPPRRSSGRGGCRPRHCRPERRPCGRIGTVPVARLRGRRPPHHDVRRVPRSQRAPGLGGDHRWRRRRVRVRLAPGRPRLQGDDSGGAGHDPPGLRRGHRPAAGPLLQEAGHRHRHGCEGRGPHALAGRDDDDGEGGGPDVRRGSGRRIGGPAPPHRRAGGRRAGRRDGPPRLRGDRRIPAHRCRRRVRRG